MVMIVAKAKYSVNLPVPLSVLFHLVLLLPTVIASNTCIDPFEDIAYLTKRNFRRAEGIPY